MPTNSQDYAVPGNARLLSVPRRFGTTGRYVVTFRKAVEEADKVAALTSLTGGNVTNTRDSQSNAVSVLSVQGNHAVFFERLGVAVANFTPPQVAALSADQSGAIVAVRPERYFYALSDLLTVTADYLRGYQAGVNHLAGALLDAGGQSTARAADVDEAQATWGLQATNAVNSRLTGQGVKIAILDTGLDFNHPDFAGRAVTSQSFVNGVATAQDGHGHGTHCAGIACGPLHPAVLPRYGVAGSATLFVGKVLDDTGTGEEGAIINGIDWAIRNGCQVISMSPGSPVNVGAAPDPQYEAIGQRALEQGTLIVAAAGNDSDRRFGSIQPVSSPADATSIVAVAALDQSLQVAYFSNGGINPGGGQIDIAAPGVDIYSSFPMPTQYRRLDGTSMASPHVAGVAALLREANPGANAYQLWSLLSQTARRLPLPGTDVGAGLVQAPGF